jgi:hypothetical protein
MDIKGVLAEAIERLASKLGVPSRPLRGEALEIDVGRRQRSAVCPLTGRRVEAA